MARRLAIVAAVGLIGILAGCGNETVGLGFGDIVLTEINLDAVAGPAGCVPLTPGVADPFPTTPTEFAISGTGFSTVIGNAVTVRFYASASALAYVPGPLPFLGGTSGTVDVVGTVFSDTLVCGTTPPVLICGPASVVAFVEVILQSGVRDDSTAGPTFVITFTPPTVVSLSQSCFGSLTPSVFTITGTGFGTDGDVVTVRFQATDSTVPPVVDPIFNDGNSTSVDETGVVSGGGTVITTQSPRSTNQPLSAADPLFVTSDPIEGATIQIFLLNGSCSVVNPASAITFNSPEGDTATGPGLPVPANIPQTIRRRFVITGALDGGCPDPFSPIGGTVQVSFARPAGGPATPFQLNAADVGTQAFDVVDAVITSATTIEGETPRVRADANFVPVMRIHFEDGTIAPVTTPFTWIAPPSVTGASLPLFGNGFLQGLGGLYACLTRSFTIFGLNFDAVTPASVFLFHPESGVVPDGNPEIAGVPVRRYGAGVPLFAATDDLGPPRVNLVGSITGFHRQDGNIADLAPDAGVLKNTVARVVNGDGQFDDAPIFGMTISSQTIDITNDGNTNNNPSVAIDPTSTPDDFATATGIQDAVNGANMTVVAENDPTNAAGFEATDVFCAFSRDGGATFTIRTPIGSPEDGFDPGALRNFAMCAYDAFGNLWVSYLVDDFGVTDFSYIVLLRSSDQGATFDPPIVLATSVSVGTFDRPCLATGTEPLTGFEAAYVTWVDHDLFPDRVFAAMAFTPAFGVPGAPLPPVQVDDGFGGFFGFMLHARCAVGPQGQLEVVWTEPDFIGLGGIAIRFDRDRDGLLSGAQVFDADSFVDFVPFLAAPLASSPDAGPPLPLPAIAVARAGTHSGRVVIAYEVPVPFPGGNPQNVNVFSRYTDDDGFNFSDRESVHPADASDQFVPALTADTLTGRFHVMWYDTSADFPLNSAVEAVAAASDDGATWGDPAGDPFGFVPVSTAAGGDGEITDYGIQAGLSAHGGCVLSGQAINDGGRMETFLRLFQQTATTVPPGP
jgi:hypothetical protein